MRLHPVALLLACAGAAAAAGKKSPPNNTPSAADLAPFPWPHPFKLPALKNYDVTCESTATFAATQYVLHDLYESPPLGLWPWGEALKRYFTDVEYPRSWDGSDAHGYERELMMMEFADMPLRAREWIAAKGGKLFAVYDKPDGQWIKINSPADLPKPKTKASSDDPAAPESTAEAANEVKDESDLQVAIFAPGALYHILPLLVAEGSGCEEAFGDLDNYSATPKDGAVIAGITEHTAPDRTNKKRDIEVSIKVQLLKKKDGVVEEAPEPASEAAKDTKDEL